MITKKELQEYLEGEIVGNKCDTTEDRLFKLAVLEAMNDTIDRHTDMGKSMIHLLDSVNDVLQKIGIINPDEVFYRKTN